MVPLPPLKYALLVNTLRGHAAEFGVIAGKAIAQMAMGKALNDKVVSLAGRLPQIWAPLPPRQPPTPSLQRFASSTSCYTATG